MAPTNITQQTSTAVPLQAELARAAPQPTPLQRRILAGRLQWALEGSGWSVLRPSLDFVLVCAAVAIAMGGVSGVLHPGPRRMPLLAMPPLVMALFFLRGLYRTRLRALVLDGLVPVLSAVSVAAMVVAMIGLFANGQMPTQSDWVRGWLFALVFVGFGRIVLANAQRWARSAALIG